MTINERITLLVSTLGMNNNSFSIKIGVNPTIIHNISKGRNAPSYEVIQKIMMSFDNINIEWLMLEKGEMIITEEKKEEKKEAENCTTCTNCDVLRNYIKMLEKKLYDYESNEGRAQRHTA